MKEFVIEDFTINNDNSIDIEYYFYSEISTISFTQGQIQEVFGLQYGYDDFIQNLNQNDCVRLLKYFIRDYAKKK